MTFVLDQSGERAYAMWEQSVFSVRMAGKRSKEFGADELEARPSQFLVPKGFAAAKLAEICTVFLHRSCTAKTCHTICNYNNQIEKLYPPLRMTRLLEGRYQAEGVLARGAECVAGEQASEIDNFEGVAQVRNVTLKAYRAFFVLVEICAHRNILREIRIDATEIEVEVINHHLTIFRRVLLRS